MESSNSIDQPARTELRRCCRETIDLHVSHNPMMLCQVCKYLIKCFTDEPAFRNYSTFCQSRSRGFQVGFYEGYHVIVFRSYESFAKG